ncbi:TPA: hypothetical protein OCE78_004723 [Escherichia coli]|nr:hypothetical protein [Escherichia coli]HCO9708195.1 hypothetical protein [Escherichia coli]
MEKVISHARYKLTPEEMEAFNSAVDHRLAEPTRLSVHVSGLP